MRPQLLCTVGSCSESHGAEVVDCALALTTSKLAANFLTVIIELHCAMNKTQGLRRRVVQLFHNGQVGMLLRILPSPLC